MNEHDFEELMENVKRIEMTPTEKEAQRKSFAYGNANIENSAVTREVIERAAAQIADKDGAAAELRPSQD